MKRRELVRGIGSAMVGVASMYIYALILWICGMGLGGIFILSTSIYAFVSAYAYHKLGKVVKRLGKKPYITLDYDEWYSRYRRRA